MEINNLAIFIETMRKRSFAAVARDRGVDPATISRAIVSLEEELQMRLFQRTTRKIEPTEAGLVYFERVEPLVEELTKAQLLAIEVNEQPQGVLRIACPVSFAQFNLTPLLPEFSQLYPQLRYELVLTDSAPDLISERLDVAIRVGPLPDSSLIVHKLCPLVARICATPEYLKKHGWPQTPQELVKHKCLLLALPGFTRSNWKFTDKQGQSQEVAVSEFLRTSNAMALKQCALAGMGITLQARWLIGRELQEGSLVDVFPDYEVTAALDEAAAWLLYPSRSYLPLKVRVFVDFLKRKYKDGAPWEQALIPTAKV